MLKGCIASQSEVIRAIVLWGCPALDDQLRRVDHVQIVIVQVAAQQPVSVRVDLDPDPASVPGVNTLQCVSGMMIRAVWCSGIALHHNPR